jgi:hypothetical protein
MKEDFAHSHWIYNVGFPSIQINTGVGNVARNSIAERDWDSKRREKAYAVISNYPSGFYRPAVSKWHEGFVGSS